MLLSNSRGPDSLQAVTLGPRRSRDPEKEPEPTWCLSARWPQCLKHLSGLPQWNGFLIDAANPIVPPGFSMADLRGASAEIVASLVSAPGGQGLNTCQSHCWRLTRTNRGRRAVHVRRRRRRQVAGRRAAFKAGFAIDVSTLEWRVLYEVPGGLLTNLNLIRLTDAPMTNPSTLGAAVPAIGRILMSAIFLVSVAESWPLRRPLPSSSLRQPAFPASRIRDRRLRRLFGGVAWRYLRAHCGRRTCRLLHAAALLFTATLAIRTSFSLPQNVAWPAGCCGRGVWRRSLQPDALRGQVKHERVLQ
jgi:hypothetical protein